VYGVGKSQDEEGEKTKLFSDVIISARNKSSPRNDFGTFTWSAALST